MHAILLLDEHWMHCPSTQAGSVAVGQADVALEPLSPLQATQAFVATLQTGLLAGQLALDVQPQVPVVVLHTGVTPEQALALVLEHCMHCPVTHAGSAVVGQGNVEPEPLSPLHGSQVLAVVLHTGPLAGQLALASQPQTWFATMQTGVVPPHAVAFEAEHWTHCALTQAGARAVGQWSTLDDPLSPSHPTQTPAFVLHTGSPAGHSTLLEQPHAPVAKLQVGVTSVHALMCADEHC